MKVNDKIRGRRVRDGRQVEGIVLEINKNTFTICNSRTGLSDLVYMDGAILIEHEEEKLYEVVLFNDGTDRLLLMELAEHSWEIDWECNNDGCRTQWFTKQQIISHDERYWSFAVPVKKEGRFWSFLLPVENEE